MQKLGLRQTQKMALSPKQMQLVQMLQVPADRMWERIQEEVAQNPTLEVAQEEEGSSEVKEGLISMKGSLSGIKRRLSTVVPEELLKSKLGILQPSFYERLLHQISLLSLNKREMAIGRYLAGSLSTDGYLRMSLEVIVHNLSFSHYIDSDKEEVGRVLGCLQGLDPPGIAARDLRECLLLQLARRVKSEKVVLAQRILTHAFEAFSKKNYDKIAHSMNIVDENLFREALSLIRHLAPRPIVDYTQEVAPRRKRPDFIVYQDEEEEMKVDFYYDYMPSLRIRKEYGEMLNHYDRKKDEKAIEVKNFVKDSIQRAQWFIESIQKRRDTLLRTMEAIVKLQEPFFKMQDEDKLRPLFMRHIAKEIGMDISTVSRVVSGKSVLTDLGTFPLKYFFSEPISTAGGEKVSNRTIKSVLKTLIENEDKQRPYTDEELVFHIQAKGYLVARRTVAKYRNQLRFPVARMRKEL